MGRLLFESGHYSNLVVTETEELDQFSAHAAEFVDCRFEGLIVNDLCFGAGTDRSLYTNCVFSDCQFRYGTLGVARLENTDFSACRLRNLFFLDLDLIDCTFDGQLWDCIINAERPDGGPKNEIRGNDFSCADLRRSGFRSGVALAEQKFSLEQRANIVFDAAKKMDSIEAVAQDLQDAQFRDDVLTVLRIRRSDVDEGQADLYWDSSSLPKKLRPAGEWLCRELLRSDP